MRDSDASGSQPFSRFHEMLGFSGVALAVVGIVDLPTELRMVALMAASLFLSISFQFQMQWPRWVRWTLSALVNSFLAFIAWSTLRHP